MLHINLEIGKKQKKNQLLKTSGRTQLTEKLKNALLERYGARCNLYGEKYPAKLLQPDHRIPYEIGGIQKYDGFEPIYVIVPFSKQRQVLGM